jgi:hypothetical protein
MSLQTRDHRAKALCAVRHSPACAAGCRIWLSYSLLRSLPVADACVNDLNAHVLGACCAAREAPRLERLRVKSRPGDAVAFALRRCAGWLLEQGSELLEGQLCSAARGAASVGTRAAGQRAGKHTNVRAEMARAHTAPVFASDVSAATQSAAA